MSVWFHEFTTRAIGGLGTPQRFLQVSVLEKDAPSMAIVKASLQQREAPDVVFYTTDTEVPGCVFVCAVFVLWVCVNEL